MDLAKGKAGQCGQSDGLPGISPAKQCLVLSYPSAVAIATFNTTFNQKLSAKDLILVNRIVIPLTGQARIYLLRDQGRLCIVIKLTRNA